VTINRIPNGLLGWLGIKNFGRNPVTLGEQVIPTWDLSKLYLEADAEYLQVTSTITGTGYTVVFGPSQNEVWVVTDYSLDLATGAAETWSGALSRATPNNLGQVRIADNRALAASQWLCTVPALHGDIYLAPGESLGVNTDAVTGTIDLVGNLRFVRLPI